MDSPANEPASPTVTIGASIGAPALRGSIWTMGGYAASQILRLAGNLILTRLLFPAVFGEMALVFIFIQGLQMFSDVGTGPAIVQNERGDEADFLNTAWTIQGLRGVVLWLASWAIAWPVAEFYGQPMYRWLVPAAGLTAVVLGFESTATATLQRHLRLERLTILEVAAQVVGIASTVLLALANRWAFGANDPSAVWAIVVGSVLSTLTRLALSHTYLPGIRNRFRLDPEATRQLMRFGRWIFVSTLLTFLAAQSDRLIFAKKIPIALFGVYSIAAMLAALPTQAVLKLGGAVVFPAYSRLVGRADFKELFWRVRSPLLVGGASIVTAMIASGPFLIRFLYDRRYEDAGWIMQYLSAMAWFQVLECTNGAALLAKGHVRWVALGSGIKFASMVVLIPAGFHYGGFPGALVGLVGSELLKYLASAWGAATAGLRGFGRDAILTMLVAATSGAGFALGSLTGERFPGKLPALVVATGVAIIPWLAVGFWQFGRRKSGGGWDQAGPPPAAAPEP
jgi:O-antigen/teichoic acid export membrane protein